MDKEEAERLSRAIGRVHMDWIEVHGVEYNTQIGNYEVRCTYRQEQKDLATEREPWTALLITSPRQWITLLTQHK